MTRTNAGDPTAGQNYELVAITAVILGGAKLFGGEASALGTLLGVLCLSTLQNGLNLLAVSSYYQVLFIGLVLISAALLERIGEKG
jgi:ribose/xylose/arabinose/galactoside ABC-type transport system permease subunit